MIQAGRVAEVTAAWWQLNGRWNAPPMIVVGCLEEWERAFCGLDPSVPSLRVWTEMPSVAGDWSSGCLGLQLQAVCKGHHTRGGGEKVVATRRPPGLEV